jgi:hypothetical protein
MGGMVEEQIFQNSYRRQQRERRRFGTFKTISPFSLRPPVKWIERNGEKTFR